MHDFEMQEFAYGILNILDSGIAKLGHFMAIGANQMVVLFVAIRFLVLRQILSELMLADQVAFY